MTISPTLRANTHMIATQLHGMMNVIQGLPMEWLKYRVELIAVLSQNLVKSGYEVTSSS